MSEQARKRNLSDESTPNENKNTKESIAKKTLYIKKAVMSVDFMEATLGELKTISTLSSQL